jgi:hypothetical protein
MKHFVLKTISILLYSLGVFILFCSCSQQYTSQQLKSIDDLNEISISLTKNGELNYEVSRKGNIVIQKSQMGLRFDDQDFTSGLTLAKVSPVQKKREKYQLKVGNKSQIDQVFNSQSISFKNRSGALMILDLIAGKEGVAFRYRFPESDKKQLIVEEEITGFRIEENAKGWLQPYNKAGQYTPAYEDFYFKVSPGDTISNPRNPSVGWCMPALFNVNNGKEWVLIAESGTDGSYPGCHFKPNSEDGVYKIAFAKEDERFTVPIDENSSAKPQSKLPWTMPWRVIIIGDDAGEILLSTLITDLAPASKIDDTSWIKTGKASWSWWSHNDDNSPEVYNEFTDLASSFGWEYTLFDAGWQKADSIGGIIDHAISKGIKPLVWGYSANYFDSGERKKKFKELADMGVSGVKIDFWCSDRQEAMGVLESLFEDAAKEQLLVNLHGSTIPRGWHRTWPNFVSAEAVLGTESYFYDQGFPEKAAEQNTVLPFTRNVAGPTDYTPIALTIRKFPRLNTAVHELATSMIYTSGIIHFADSREVFESLPEDIKNLLKEVPATWDKTESLMAEPGKLIVLSRERGSLSYIVGINGTDKELPIKLDLSQYSRRFSDFKLITEGTDPLMDFATETKPLVADWSYSIAPKGGFIIQLVN